MMSAGLKNSCQHVGNEFLDGESSEHVLSLCHLGPRIQY